LSEIDDARPNAPSKEARGCIMRALLVLTTIYLASVLSWVVLQVLFDSRWWWLFLLNNLSLYLFLPLPLLLIPLAITNRALLVPKSIPPFYTLIYRQHGAFLLSLKRGQA
jgi:hypothetical protein